MLTVFFLLLYGATLDLPVLTHSSLHCALPISRPICAAPIAWRPESGAFDRPLLRSADAGMTSRRDCDRPGDGAVLLPSARPFGKRRACRGGDRKSVVKGTRVSVRVDHGGRRISKTKTAKCEV